MTTQNQQARRLFGVSSHLGRETSGSELVAAGPTVWRKTGGCGACHARSKLAIVWGLPVCEWCARQITRAAPTGVVTGLGYFVAVSAFVQWIREARGVR